MKTKAINTRYGVIFSRNALILTEQTLTVYPLQLTIKASLSLQGCRPQPKDEQDVEIGFHFTDISSLAVYKLDDYPYEKFSSSSFDEVEEHQDEIRQRIIVSTYDYVFDVVGQYQIQYAEE